MRLGDSDVTSNFLVYQIATKAIPLIKIPVTKFSILILHNTKSHVLLLKMKRGSIWTMTMIGNIRSQKLGQSQPAEFGLNNDVDLHREDAVL